MSDASRLQQLLDQLARMGKLTLHSRRIDDHGFIALRGRAHHGGWRATLEIAGPEGVEASIASDNRHETALEALECVARRLDDLRRDVASDTYALPHS